MREKKYQPGCRSCVLLHFPVPFTSLRQLPPFLWGTGWKPICEWERLQEKGCPRLWPVHCSPSSAAPSSCRSPDPCFPPGCRFAHIKNSSGRGGTYITLQYSVLTAEGFERPSAQSTWSSGPCTRASRGTVIQRARWFLQVWSEQEHLYPSLA